MGAALVAMFVLSYRSPGQAQTAAAAQFVANEVIVQFRRDAGDSARVTSLADMGVASVQTLRSGGSGRLELLRTTLPVEDVVERLRALPQVEFAEPNWLVQPEVPVDQQLTGHPATDQPRAPLFPLDTPNDPYYSSPIMWGMHGDGTSPANQFGSQAGELWARGFTGSSGVFVGVLDGGIDFSHPDLAPNMWVNPFDPVDGIDNDGNGYVDDVRGWDFVHDDNSIYDGIPDERSNELIGTHHAGTIGARGGNGIGVVGMNWQVTMIGVKIIGPQSATVADAIEGIAYITDLKVRHGLNIVATSNAWRVSGVYSAALHQAIIRAAKQEILFVSTASGGWGNDRQTEYPSGFDTTRPAGSESAASYDAVISVVSIDESGERYPYQADGLRTIDLGAPGHQIFSTMPQNGYITLGGGTSASAHVTGAVALYKSMRPEASAAAIRSYVISQGTHTASLAGVTVSGRRLNVGDFTAGPVPAEFSKLAPASGTIGIQTEAVLAWAPASGATAFEYCLDAIDDGVCSGAWTSAGLDTSVHVRLGQAATYYWQVRAVNASGPMDADDGRWWMLGTNGAARYDASRRAPTCSGLGSACDSGELLFSRGTRVGGGEPNQPNTLADSCADGDHEYDQFAKSTDRLRVSTLDGGLFAPGKTVQVAATVWGHAFGGNTVDLFYSANADNPSWTLLARLAPTARGTQTLIANYTLPAGAVQAVRAVFGSSGWNALSCSPSSYNDHDDLAFRVEGTPFTDNALTPGVHLIRAVHVQELRTRINNVRVQQGLSPASWTDAALVLVRAVHLNELRSALAAVYGARSRTPPTYTDATLVAGVTPVKALHITELRAAVLAAE